MTGAEILIETAVKAGIEVCFTNPGTTELPLVFAFDSVAGIRSVLGLFEGCCTGAADGYGRMTDKPAMNLLHLGPGLGNGIANLHNARRGRTPVLNVIGEHATWHRSAAARIKAKTGCDLLSERAPARMERGAGIPATEFIPLERALKEPGPHLIEIEI